MKSILYKSFVLILFLGAISACDDFGDMNVDPNEPTDVPAEGLVTNALFASGYLYWDRPFNFEYGMLLAQHLAQAEYTEEQRYDFDAADFDFKWATTYAGGYAGNNIGQGVLADLREAKRLIEADESLSAAVKGNQIAVLDIMEAFQFQVATDIWGDIPYSQALQPDEYIQPVYDAQSSIYTALIGKVSSAVDAITTSAAGFSSNGDLIYNGDMEGWKMFGHSLLVRMGMRVADRDATLAGTAVNKGLAGAYQGIDDEATLIFNENELTANPFWYDASPSGGSRDDFRISAELFDALEGMGDPRAYLYADSTVTGNYVGLPYGLEDGPSFELKGSTSRFTATLREATAPACLLRYSEVKFLHAEAIERGLVSGGDAETEFNAAVTAAMNEWGVMDQAAIDAYLAANPYDAGNWKQSIGMQMWFALYGNGMEAWSTWRRLDVPTLAVPPAALTNYIPVRGLYPTTEGGTNSQNMLAVPYDDVMSSKVWWDVN
jgi:hypothetical protein